MERQLESQHKSPTIQKQVPDTPSDGVSDTHKNEALRWTSKKTGIL